MWEEELKVAKELAVKAGKKIMEYYRNSFEVEIKDDNSPVTSADKAANEIIVTALKEKFSTFAILSEEIADDFSRLDNDLVWIIDPLDGTKDFVKHEDGFAVNIALSYKHELVVGVVYIPVSEELYYAVRGQGSFYEHNGHIDRIHVNNKTTDLTCLASKNHLQEEEKLLLEKYKSRISKVIPVGASIKPCLIARGEAEISYRTSPNTKEWDTAAPQIILEEAGGYILLPNGEPIRYNRKDVHNKDGCICINCKDNFLL